MHHDPLFLGCQPDYVSECFDHSDKFICPASACSNETEKAFLCRDGKYCIDVMLMCDGYVQCEDESGISNQTISHAVSTRY